MGTLVPLDLRFSPDAHGAHGAGERVYRPSVFQPAQVMALFIKDWCSVT
jgi:hypothetical protein